MGSIGFSGLWILAALTGGLQAAAQDSIVFPSDTAAPQTYPVNPCGGNQTFCESVPNYPQAQIDAYIDAHLHLYAGVFDTETTVRLDSRFADSAGQADEQSLCESVSNYYRPQTAARDDGTFAQIVNTATHMQVILIEKCRSENGACDFDRNFANGLKTRCHQHYSYQKVLTMGNDNETKWESIKFPSCCQCRVRLTTTN